MYLGAHAGGCNVLLPTLGFPTLSTDVDDGAQRQNDRGEHHQQHHQVAVQDSPAVAIEAALVESVQDQRPNPPEGSAKKQK